jgi:hypothetical protein
MQIMVLQTNACRLRSETDTHGVVYLSLVERPWRRGQTLRGKRQHDVDLDKAAYVNAQHSYMGAHFDQVRNSPQALIPTTTLSSFDSHSFIIRRSHNVGVLAVYGRF